jgi:hypothetical protein
MEWEDRICSINVDPARGMPTMKMGSRASHPPGRWVNASLVNRRMISSTFLLISLAR